MLTPAQETTLAAAIRADTDPLVIAALAMRNDVGLAELYNAASTFIVWRKNIPTSEIASVDPIYVAIANLTTGNQTRMQLFLDLNPNSYSATAGIDAMFLDLFSGALGGQGQATRDGLQALNRRAATKCEALFATGTGTTVDPGNLVVEVTLYHGDISRALNNNPA